MLALAVLAASGMALARQAGALPHRVVFSRMVLTAAPAGGGFGYLLLNPALAWKTWVSLR